jgi:pimeloyl-ACP methyl ester carboxylesterase
MSCSIEPSAPPTYWEEFFADLPLDIVRPSKVRASDSLSLQVYEMGAPDAPVVVIANPLGTSFLLMLPVARLLATEYRVVSWELRGSPFLDDGAVALSVGLERHAADLAEVTRALGINRFHLLTWCNGGLIAAWAKSTLPLGLLSVSSIALSLVTQPSDNAFLHTLRRITESYEADNDVLDLCKLVRFGSVDGLARVGTSRLMQELACLSLKTPSSIITYAQLLRDFDESVTRCVGPDAISDLFVELQRAVPSLLLHCLDDHVADYRSTLEVTEKARSCQLHLYPKGGHFVPFLMPERIAADVLTFISTLS